MKDTGKTKAQLINELMALRQRVAELEASEEHHKIVEKKLRESEERFRKFADEASFEGIIFSSLHQNGKLLNTVLILCNETDLSYVVVFSHQKYIRRDKPLHKQYIQHTFPDQSHNG